MKGAIGLADSALPAVMAGLAGVPGVHGFKAPTFVTQAHGQLAPVAGQYAAVQTRLDFDVGTGVVPVRRLRHVLDVQYLGSEGRSLVGQRAADVGRVIGLNPFPSSPQFLQLTAQPPRREFLAQAEETQTGSGADAVLPPAVVGVGLARQKVILHKTTGSHCAGQLLGRGARPWQQPQPPTAVDQFSLCYIGRSRHGIYSSLSVRER